MQKKINNVYYQRDLQKNRNDEMSDEMKKLSSVDWMCLGFMIYLVLCPYQFLRLSLNIYTLAFGA